MRKYHHLSVATKLALVAIGSCFIAVFLCSAGFMYHEYRSLRTKKLSQIQTIAGMIEFNSSAVLTFRRRDSAAALLESVRMDPSIEMACLYDAEGAVLATYQKNPRKQIAPPAEPGRGYRFDERGQLVYFSPVIHDGKQVGTLLLLANTEEFYAQMERYVRLAVAVMFVSLLGSIGVSVLMQRALTAPIARLVATAHQISSGGDYSIRVHCGSRDEIGRLYDAFNHMLQRVQESEGALQTAYDELEDHVRQRTAQLREEIQQRQRIQDELVFAIKAAEAASHAKSEFLANMSHEIRTPLNSILGFTDLLLRGADGGHPIARQEYLETIQTSGRHLLELINDILDLSKIEAGRMEIERVACSPHAIIAEVLSVARIAAVDKQLDLRYRWDTAMPVTIQTDPAKFRQLLLNVVGNAIKFTEEGSVTVSARLTDAARPMLVVEVRDTGIGISEDKLQRVFDPFVQGDSSLTRRYGGTGLGLAICARICKHLDGDLAVHSEVGKGSTFTITIDPGPLEGVAMLESPSSDALISSRHEKQTEVENFEGVLRGRDILLVEDGQTNRKVIGLMLQEAGARVTTAENGKLGFEAAVARQFDLILMDMQMPVMDGYTATLRIRQEGIDAPIIALTAHAMRGDAEKCLSAGCSGYLSKPVEFDTLIRTCVESLGMEGNKAPRGAISPIQVETRAVAPIASLLPTANRAFAEIVVEFVEHLEKQRAAMRVAQREGDVAAMRRLAHWLRGTGGTAGFPQLSDWGLRLGEAAADSDWPRIDKILREVEALADRIVIPVLSQDS